MGIKASWQPSPEDDIASYDLEKSVSGPNGIFTFLANVPHIIDGPNWDAEDESFFYTDPVGQVSDWYRLTAIDAGGQRSLPSPAFQPELDAPPVTSNVRIDHDYGSPGDLRYVAPGGIGIEGAVVRVFHKFAFDVGDTDNPIAVTRTTVGGRWVSPVFLMTGHTYVIQFHKEGLYGPDLREIIV